MLKAVAIGGRGLERQTESQFIEDFKQLRSAVRGYFINRGLSSEDADDLTQDTFLLAFRGLDGFRGEAEFKTWLFSIADNVFNKAIRRSKALKRVGHETALESLSPDKMADLASPAAGQSDWRLRYEGAQLRELLTEEYLGLTQKALDGLPSKMQRCILLYVHQDRKYHEIAALMNLSINTVKAHIHQARKRLKQALGERFDGLGR